MILENSTQFIFFNRNVLDVQVAFPHATLNDEPEQKSWSYYDGTCVAVEGSRSLGLELLLN